MRSVLTGFNGTTMPGFRLVPGQEDNLWHLAAFLRSLQQPREPVARQPVDSTTVRGYWQTPIPHQRGPLSAVSCASCHASQFRDWLGTRHSVAMSPGVWAQMHDQPELSGNCLGCHAPLGEQSSDDYLIADGVSCAVCHARADEVFGPPLGRRHSRPWWRVCRRPTGPHGFEISSNAPTSVPGATSSPTAKDRR